MDAKPNDERVNKHVVSEEDKRKVAAIIAAMPISVSTNLSTGEVTKIYKNGRVVKSTTAPILPTVTKTRDDTVGTGKIEFKINLDI